MVQYIYTLGATGERLSVTELDWAVEYTYDDLYRLTGETITEGEKVTAYTYAYDSVGNRILKTKNGAETEYSYNELNQLVSDSDATYEYDLNGNLVRVIGGAQSALYKYRCSWIIKILFKYNLGLQVAFGDSASEKVSYAESST